MDYTEDLILADVNNKFKKRINYTQRSGPDRDQVFIKTIDAKAGKSWQNVSRIIKEMFLPEGYPDSVSSDYLEYQMWDTLQAFCSSISGTFAMSAVMKGIGVGSDTATPISAAITWLLKDGTGMIGGILFTWYKGSSLDVDSKKWRFFADILNDLAMFVELCIPFVINYSLYMLFIATTLKSLVGTAGSSTRVAFITHQAIKGNIADVSAKDGSQETVTNLCAFVFGIFLLKNVTETSQIWTVMCICTLLHIIFNYKAVTCLRFNVFNSERFSICLRTYFPTSAVPTVQHVNRWESVLIRRINDVTICNFSIVFGDSLDKVLGSHQLIPSQLIAITTIFESKSYLILADTKKNVLYISFRQTFKDSDVLKSYFHAYLIGISLTLLQGGKTLDVVSRSRKNSPIYRLRNILNEFLKTDPGNDSEHEQENKIIMQAFMTCGDFVEKEYSAFVLACVEMNWQLHKHLIQIGDWRGQWPYKPEVRQMKRLTSSRLRKEAYRKDGNLVLIN